MTDKLLDNMRPRSIARLMAELIADHADEMDDDEFVFRTEDAKKAFADLLDAGIRNCGKDRFFAMIDLAVDAELGGRVA